MENRILTLGSLFDGLYRITNDGRLFSYRNNKYLKPATDKYGYEYFVISINGERKTLKAHRLVAQAYIPNIEDKPTVNHINGIRNDNRMSNLEWATYKEQQETPVTKLKSSLVHQKTDYRKMSEVRNFGRKKTAVYKSKSMIGIYPSLKDAAIANGCNYGKASLCANGKRANTGGLRFCYV